jgi:membrane associated rhomboid family serine protease
MNPQAERDGPAPGMVRNPNPKPPAAAGMSIRKIVPRVMNALLWLVCCAMAGTGLLLAFRLPPGSRGGRGLSALDLSRHEWGDIHTWLSYAFLALMVAHLALHWRWFWQVAARKKRWPLVLGFGVGIALLLALAFQPVTKGGDDHEHEDETAAPHRGGRNR